MKARMNIAMSPIMIEHDEHSNMAIAMVTQEIYDHHGD